MFFSIQIRHHQQHPVEFVCPRCGLDRDGWIATPVRWFQVGPFRLIRLAELERIVRCADCDHESDLGALDVPTSAQLTALLEDAWIAAIVRAVRSTDDPHDEATLARARGTLAAAGFDDSADGLGRAIEALTDEAIQRRLRRLAPEMTPFGKQGFLHRVASTVIDDGYPNADELAALETVGFDLGMAAPHVHGVLAVASTPTASVDV